LVEDECRFQETPNEYYEWTTKGYSPVVKILHSNESKSFYGGLSKNTGEVIAHICDRQNSDETIRWLEIVKLKYHGCGVVLIVWDNASWHKSKKIRQWLEQNPGIVELMNFPPYCPELNPQEHVWKETRHFLSSYISRTNFSDLIDKVCRFLLTKKFHFKFF
jgi:transposase